MTNINEIGRLTFDEYNLLMKSAALKKLDEEHRNHKIAWLFREVKRTKMVGKKECYEYLTFKDFFDYDEKLKLINGTIEEKVNDEEFYELMLKANS